MFKVLPGTYDSPNDVAMEDNFGPSVTDTLGAMTHKQQIDRIMAAGRQLENWRRAHFPPGTDVPDDFVPPGYNPDYMDLVDEARQIVNGKTRAAARVAVAEKKAAEAAEKAAEQPVSEEPAPE